MDSLRWILLLIGIAIVAGIWWLGHRHSRERDESLFERARRSPRDNGESAGPEDGGLPDFEISSLEPASADMSAGDSGVPASQASGRSGKAAVTEPEGADAVNTQRERVGTRSPSSRPGTTSSDSGQEGRLEVVYVIAPAGERFVGARLQELFANQGLQHGEMEIFHKHDAEGRALFSIANLIEPGTFDPATMDTLSTPGLALFVRLPGPTSAEIAFDRMIATARALADTLEGRVLDQQHSTMTRQTEQHLRDQMRAFDLHHQPGRR